MAQVSIDILVENIAGMINRMDEKKLETLYRIAYVRRFK